MEGRAPAYYIDKYAKDPTNKTIFSDDPLWYVTLLPGTDGYRLPTEAQWEYACRAGTTTPFSAGHTITAFQANFNGTPYMSSDPVDQPNLGRTAEVGSYPPNDRGLYDMHGNVYEWCWDYIWEDAEDNELHPYINYYITHPGPITDPLGQDIGDRKVERGGSWNVWAIRLRSAWRERARPVSRSFEVGFRVVRPLPGETW
jgi:formylglycine-generating enzyme required for sulfatase activity